MANERGKIGVVDITDPDVTIGGLDNLAVNPNVARIVRGCADADPVWAHVQEIRATIAFETTQLSLLANAGIAGAVCTPLDAYFQKNKWGSTMELYSAAKHLKVAAAKALLVPRTLRIPNGGIATLNCEAFAYSADGTTAAIAVTANQAMPATGEATEMFTMGPVSLNGTEVHAEEVIVDFGLDVQVVTVRGYLWPTLVYVRERRPQIRIRCPEIDALSTQTIDGTIQGDTDSTIVAQKCSESGNRVSNAVGEHVKITIDDGWIQPEEVGGAAGEEAMTDLVFTPLYDGTAAILVIATDATF